jgi:hypothetical protein
LIQPRFANAGVNIMTDIAVATLPLPFLNQLQLPNRQRYALMIVFALGGFTCIISILRLQSLLVFLQTTDISYHNPLAAIWSNLEVNIGIVCSCLPTLKAMVTRWFPRTFNSSYLRGSDHSHEQNGRANGAENGYVGKKNDSSGSSPYYGSIGSSNPAAIKEEERPFDILTRARGPGHEPATQKIMMRSEPREQREQREHRRVWGRNGNGDDSLEDIEFGAVRDKGDRGGSERALEEARGIRVVTVVEQEVEKGYAGYGRASGDAKSDAGSERESVGGLRRERFV